MLQEPVCWGLVLSPRLPSWVPGLAGAGAALQHREGYEGHPRGARCP